MAQALKLVFVYFIFFLRIKLSFKCGEMTDGSQKVGLCRDLLCYLRIIIF